MKKLLVFFLFVSIKFFAQIPTQPKQPIVKDPFFNQTKKSQPAEQVELIHSDEFGIVKGKYDDNPFFSGNVQFSHQGSTLTADEVIFYK